MASITGLNTLYDAFANNRAGDVTTNYSTTFDQVAGHYKAFFSDDVDTDPLDSHVFASAYASSDNPAFTNAEVITNVEVGLVGPGVFDCDTITFSSSSVPDSSLTGGTAVESLIIARFVTDAAHSPLMVHIGSATGLSGGLVPNGAPVTVIISTSGLFEF